VGTIGATTVTVRYRKRRYRRSAETARSLEISEANVRVIRHRAIQQLRDCMAMGVDRAIHLQTDGEEWDSQATAGAWIFLILTLVVITFLVRRLLKAEPA
jgi:electron transfer flavoprotein alpha/beta subunit